MGRCASPLAVVWMMVLLVLLGKACPAPAAARPPLRAATFRCDVTPPAGQPVIWNVPVTKVLDRLWAKGIILQQGDERYVLCALDWCELCNDSDLWLRRKLAEAAGTTIDRVAVHTVHQHAAPYADQRAHRYLDEAPQPVLRLSDEFLNGMADSLGQAAREALGRMSDFDRIGTSQAKVDRIASTRRLRNPAGGITTRYSSGAKNPALANAPEGDIDPFLKTITLAKGDRPLARLHFYATHPQTFACDGRASSDFAGIAREAMEKQEGVFQIYLTGCSGDVTAGKYSDGSDASRASLAGRLLEAMKASAAATRWQAAERLDWRSVELRLTPREEPRYSRDALLASIRNPKAAPYIRVYESAIRLAFIERQDRPLRVDALSVGDVTIVQLPGEPMLEFQRFAQGLRPERFVAVAGYFDCGPGYICTDQAFKEGGYEPTAASAGIGTEARLKAAIRQSLGGR